MPLEQPLCCSKKYSRLLSFVEVLVVNSAASIDIGSGSQENQQMPFLHTITLLFYHHCYWSQQTKLNRLLPVFFKAATQSVFVLL